MWEEVYKELGALEASEQVYYLMILRGGDINEGGSVVFDPETGYVIIRFRNYDSRTAIAYLAHELKHAYQFETGELSLSLLGTGGVLYDIMDEVEAYRRSQMFGLYRGTVITPYTVRYELGQGRYRNLPEERRNIHTIAFDEGITWGYFIAERLWMLGRMGKTLGECVQCQVIKGWRRFYMQGIRGEPFAY